MDDTPTDQQRGRHALVVVYPVVNANPRYRRVDIMGRRSRRSTGSGRGADVAERVEGSVRQRRLPPPELGPMLAAARMRRGLRGREAARLAGMDSGYLVRLESGQRVPSKVVAEKLAEVLELDQVEREELFSSAVDDAGRGYWRRVSAEQHPAGQPQ